MNRRFCNGMVHVIKEGENLYQLSRAYRVPLALILRANPYVDVYNLQVGQEICIPVARPFGGMMMPPMGRPGRPQGRPVPPQNRNTRMPEQEERTEDEDDRWEEEEERREEEQERREEEQERREEEQDRAPLAETEEEGNPVTCVSDGTKSFGRILRENGITMEQFFEMNDPEQVILAADVVYELPNKV